MATDRLWILADGARWYDLPSDALYRVRKYKCLAITPSQATYLYNRLKKELYHPKLFFYLSRLLHPYGGLSDPPNLDKDIHQIVINPEREVVPISIHEMLHRVYSQAEEFEVHAMEAQLLYAWSEKQVSSYAEMVFNRCNESNRPAYDVKEGIAEYRKGRGIFICNNQKYCPAPRFPA